jgi:hypothetical protein
LVRSSAKKLVQNNAAVVDPISLILAQSLRVDDDLEDGEELWDGTKECMQW